MEDVLDVTTGKELVVGVKLKYGFGLVNNSTVVTE
jgi:hypothetical protein